MKPYIHKVQYYETDMMGITHHANYIHWMEEARIDFMDQLGFPYVADNCSRAMRNRRRGIAGREVQL